MKIIHREFLPVNDACEHDIAFAVHAATIEWWKDHFVFSWFFGSREGAPDVRIALYNLNNKKDFTNSHVDGVAKWNPILFSHKENLFLCYKSGIFCDRWQSYMQNITNRESIIDCRDVTKSIKFLPTGINFSVKTPPLVVNDRIFCGSSVETYVDWTSYIEEFKFINGSLEYVNRSNPIFVPEKVLYKNTYGDLRMSLGVIQPTLWNDNGTIKAMFRSSNGLNKIYYSEMIGDNIWSTPVPTNLPNPNSSVCVSTFKDKLYLVYNDSMEGRDPLTIKRLKQVGTEFEMDGEDGILEIVSGDHRMGYSYPYMIEKDGLLHLVYTYERRQIEYCVIEL